MEIKNTSRNENRENDILFSKTISAGRRIYYIDVKLSRRGELFLVLTESKKVVNDNEEQSVVHFEKHKLFLYREDFTKFTDAMNDALSFVRETEKMDFTTEKNETPTETAEEDALIKLKIDF